VTGPAVDSPARPVDGPVDIPADGPAPARWRSEPLLARAYRRPYSGRPRLTSISSRRDGMVRWQSCVADYATCVEVPGSHIGLAFNRHAYRAVAEALATPPAPADPGHR